MLVKSEKKIIEQGFVQKSEKDLKYTVTHYQQVSLSAVAPLIPSSYPTY